MPTARPIDQYTHAGMTFDVTDSRRVAGLPRSGRAGQSGQTGQSDRSGHAEYVEHAERNGTVVLLHGFPQTAASWRIVTPILNDAGFRTLAPDQRGYSPGARPRGRRAYRIDLLVGDAVALIEWIGTGPVHVVGHDWGAAVAWMLAASRPDLVRTVTAVSVPHPGAFIRSMLSSTQLLHSYYMGIFQIPGLTEWVFRRAPRISSWMLRRFGMDRDSIRRVREEIVDSGALTGALNWYRAIPLTRPATVNRPVRVPTAYVWSDGDRALTRRGTELTGEYVHADLHVVILEDVSHWVPEHAPDALARIILDRAAQSGAL